VTDADRVVWFDLDGTLLTYDRPFREIFEDGIHPVSDAVYEAYTDALFDALDAGAATPYRRAFATTVERTALDGPPERLAADYVDAEVAAATVTPGARSALAAAADHGPVGVVTNGADPVQRRKLAATDLRSSVDAVVVSGAAGVRKPDPRLFEIAERRLSGETHVYVCDDPVTDVAGATRAGWPSILVGDAPAENGAAPSQTVESIAAVADHLAAV